MFNWANMFSVYTRFSNHVDTCILFHTYMKHNPKANFIYLHIKVGYVIFVIRIGGDEIKFEASEETVG
jgi:hypothetical protein